MKRGTYYPEEILIEKLQCGEFSWLDYVNHFSKEWQDEYEIYCKEHSKTIGDESAEDFVNYKSAQLEEAMDTGNA